MLFGLGCRWFIVKKVIQFFGNGFCGDCKGKKLTCGGLFAFIFFIFF